MPLGHFELGRPSVLTFPSGRTGELAIAWITGRITRVYLRQETDQHGELGEFLFVDLVVGKLDGRPLIVPVSIMHEETAANLCYQDHNIYSAAAGCSHSELVEISEYLVRVERLIELRNSPQVVISLGYGTSEVFGEWIAETCSALGTTEQFQRCLLVMGWYTRRNVANEALLEALRDNPANFTRLVADGLHLGTSDGLIYFNVAGTCEIRSGSLFCR